jgi:hypothetical protein
VLVVGFVLSVVNVVVVVVVVVVVTLRAHAHTRPTFVQRAFNILMLYFITLHYIALQWGKSFDDPPHFFTAGTDVRTYSVRAIQRLWNVNNPNDKST